MNYQSDILEKVVKPINDALFARINRTFQQDSAHKAKITQLWLEVNLPGFIATQNWLSESQDLNPLDYKL